MSHLKSSEIFAAHPQSGQFIAGSVEQFLSHTWVQASLNAEVRDGSILFLIKGTAFFSTKSRLKKKCLPVKIPICKLLWYRLRGNLLTWLQKQQKVKKACTSLEFEPLRLKQVKCDLLENNKICVFRF